MGSCRPMRILRFTPGRDFCPTMRIHRQSTHAEHIGNPPLSGCAGIDADLAAFTGVGSVLALPQEIGIATKCTAAKIKFYLFITLEEIRHQTTADKVLVAPVQVVVIGAGVSWLGKADRGDHSHADC